MGAYRQAADGAGLGLIMRKQSQFGPGPGEGQVLYGEGVMVNWACQGPPPNKPNLGELTGKARGWLYKQSQFRGSSRAEGRWNKQTQLAAIVGCTNKANWSTPTPRPALFGPAETPGDVTTNETTVQNEANLGTVTREGPFGVPPSGGWESLPAQPVPFRTDREEGGDSDCQTRLKAELRTEEPPSGVKHRTKPICGSRPGETQRCVDARYGGAYTGLCDDALTGTLQTHLVRERMVCATRACQLCLLPV
jgi:hypothetical protein